MAEVILMPRLSDTMTEGVIAAWHKKVGDPVKKGDLLAEVETDKATMDLESYKDGTLLYTGTDKGGKILVNDLLAIIGAPGEDISGLVKGGAASALRLGERRRHRQPCRSRRPAAAAPAAAAPAAPAAWLGPVQTGGGDPDAAIERYHDRRSDRRLAQEGGGSGEEGGYPGGYRDR